MTTQMWTTIPCSLAWLWTWIWSMAPLIWTTGHWHSQNLEKPPSGDIVFFEQWGSVRDLFLTFHTGPHLHLTSRHQHDHLTIMCIMFIIITRLYCIIITPWIYTIIISCLVPYLECWKLYFLPNSSYLSTSCSSFILLAVNFQQGYMPNMGWAKCSCPLVDLKTICYQLKFRPYML